MPQLNKNEIDNLHQDVKNFIPHLSLNCVIFRFHNHQLQIAIIRILKSEIWALPGAYIYKSESIDDAAKRILLSQTNLENLKLTQFGTFGKVDRQFKKELEILKEIGITDDLFRWFTGRFISICYYCIIQDSVKLKACPFASDIKWIDIKDAHLISMDHPYMVQVAKRRLSLDIIRKPIIKNFFPDTFTIPDLQNLYETILERDIDRGNFRQRILKTGALIKVGITEEKSKGRRPILYRLDDEAYLKSLNQEIKFGF